MSSTKAAQRAGISVDLVAKLVQLGQAKVWSAEARRPIALRPSSLPLAPNPRVTVPPKKTNQNIRQPKEAIASGTALHAIAKPTANITPVPVVNSTPPSVPDNNQIQNTRESKEAIAKPTSKTVPVSKPPATKPTPIVAPLPKKPQVRRASTLTYNPAKNHLQANALVRGLIIAKRRNSINKTIAAKVQDAISTLRSGKDINTAAKRAGVSIDKINELLTLAGG